jgi:type IV pilus assembly protein PilA
MFCRNCGMANPDSGQYCSKCGQTLAAAGAAGTAPGPTPIPGGSFATPPPATGEAPTSGKAVASLVCGIFMFFLPASIAAIILGHISLSEIRNSAGRIAGRGFAISGLVLGYLGLVIIPIMIVAAIAIPNLLRARIAANEASAVGSLRSVNTAAITYAARFENGFPSSLDVLGDGTAGESTCNHAAMLDPSLTSGRKIGYILTYTPQFPDGATAPVISPKAAAKGCTSGGASGYTLTADPLRRGTTGQRSFFTDQSGVIRFSNNRESATADSLPLFQQ